jgi:hypothetical protein
MGELRSTRPWWLVPSVGEDPASRAVWNHLQSHPHTSLRLRLPPSVYRSTPQQPSILNRSRRATNPHLNKLLTFPIAILRSALPEPMLMTGDLNMFAEMPVCEELALALSQGRMATS